MAYTIPSGYTYYDASERKTYTAGQVFNGTPATGDGLQSTDPSARPSYWYESARTDYKPAGGYIATDIPQYSFTVSAGFNVYASSTFTATTVTYLDQIAGVNVVYVYLSPSIITVNHFPNKAEYISCGGSTNLQTISGAMPNTLKSFSASGCTALRTVPSFANCSSWRYGFRAFTKCTNLVSAPQLPEGLEIMDYMFEDCPALTTGANIPSTVVRAARTYYNCINLLAAPVNNSNILTSLANCFYGCTNMTTAENFVIKGDTNLNSNYIFYNCTALRIGPPSISTTTLNLGFYNCISLENVDNTLNIIRATSLSSTFYNCQSLTETPSLANVTVSALSETFKGCTSLEVITDFPPQINNSTLSCSNTFEGCTSLQNLPILPNYISNMSSMFKNCTSLVPQNIYIPYQVNSLVQCFENDVNLSGVITLNRTLGAINNAFNNVNGPIIITGNNNLTINDVLVAGRNVYKELEIEPDIVTTVRCDDTNGTLDDNGEYIKLTAHFTSIVLPNTKLYVPKVYIKTDQQEPIVNWKLTNNTTQTTTTIANSTDISVTRIEAGNLITDGTFESYFEVGENEVLNYKVYIATSAPNVYEWDELESTIQTITKYWNGLPGSSIFTSSTFIFDATPDGNSFKIGGPIQEEEEEGFIVGNRGLPLLADQYPSTFNGPVTMASIIDLELPNYQIADTTDKKLYDIIRALGWSSDVLSQ